MEISEKMQERLFEELVEHGKTEIRAKVSAMKLEGLVLYSVPELCGYLHCYPATLAKMGLPHVDLTGAGKALLYRLEDVQEAIGKRTQRKGGAQ